MTEKELYAVYAKWSGELHHYVVRELGRHIDCEFFPDSWKFALYGGHAQEKELHPWGFSTVPALARPPGEIKELVELPKPEDNPTQADLDKTFRILCLAAAKVLQIDLGKPRLPPPPVLVKKHAFSKPENSRVISRTAKEFSPKLHKKTGRKSQ